MTGPSCASAVLVFEGQGAATMPQSPVASDGGPEASRADLSAMDDADRQEAILGFQLEQAALHSMEHTPVGSVSHSFGDLAALVAAGSLSEESARSWARTRASIRVAFAPDDPWTMVSATRLTPEAVEQIPHHQLFVASQNGERDYVIVGRSRAFAEFSSAVALREDFYRVLPVSVPYHTPLLASAAAELAKVLERVCFRAPRYPVVSAIGPQVIETAQQARHVLIDGLVQPAQWSKALHKVAERWGHARFLECGPSYSMRRFTVKARLQLDWPSHP